ncbi:MAG: prepilin-type N-terminal cleavage/methylation domain-containing protein [Phycisphaerales bacterium]|nr:prepilin-type N-terminal cleavage/methylation domain-containing protein [Phycisphaerales bacterium]
MNGSTTVSSLSARAGRSLRGAFSLTEMLVVLVIIVILLGIAIPAFRSMSQSQEKTASEARLAFALQAARDAAVNLGEGNDVAAVFTYDLGGPMRIVPCQLAGRVMDAIRGSAVPASYEVFVPVSSIEPTSLPMGWTVRAWTPGATINGGWYDDGATPRYAANQPAWVFPETGFFNHASTGDGANRQTFMVRFEGGTGKLVGVSARPVLVLLPRPSSQGRTAPNWLRADLSPDLRQMVRSYLSDPRSATLTPAMRDEVLSDKSSDCVMAKPVRVLALADESALAGALGVRVDDASRCLYAINPSDVSAGLTLSPRLVNGPTGNNPLDTVSVGRAIEFYDNPTNTGNLRTQTGEVRVYTVDRYAGSLKELTVPAP